MSNGVYQLYEFVNSGGIINKTGQSVGGIYKVPFALDAKGEEVTQEKVKHYYFASKSIDENLKLLKNKKKIYSTFFGQIFYFIEIKEQLKNFLKSIENIFSIHVSIFLDWPQPYFCPDCHQEILFDYRNFQGAERTFFSHKAILCHITDEIIETLKNRSIIDNYKCEPLKSLVNINFTKEDFLEKLKELICFIGKHEYKLHENDIEKIFSYTNKMTPSPCDFLYETEKHFRAKTAAGKAINEGKELFLLRRCSKCKKTGKQFFPTKDKYSSLEYILSEDLLRVDIAILDGNNNLTAVIEIADEQTVDEKKEKALGGIPWGEIAAETILNGNEWLVKRDKFKPYVCKECKNAHAENMFPQIIQAPEASNKGRVKFETENYFFYLDLLLKEEFRFPRYMTELVVNELNKIFYFKLTEILVFNTDGSVDIIYRANPGQKLPPDEDIMWVLSFILNGEWINIITNPNNEFKEKDYYCLLGLESRRGKKIPEDIPDLYLPYGFENENPQKYCMDNRESLYSYPKNNCLSLLLSILSRFFLLPGGKNITNIKYWEYKFRKNFSKKYRKRKGSSKYSIPHENAYGSDIEAKLGEALIRENINFKKQYEIYTDGTLLTVADFYIEAGKIIIYCDGFQYHYNKESVIKDRNQDRVLQFLRYRVLRYTGSEIVGDLDKCVREIKRFIGEFSCN